MQAASPPPTHHHTHAPFSLCVAGTQQQPPMQQRTATLLRAALSPRLLGHSSHSPALSRCCSPHAWRPLPCTPSLSAHKSGGVPHSICTPHALGSPTGGGPSRRQQSTQALQKQPQQQPTQQPSPLLQHQQPATLWPPETEVPCLQKASNKSTFSNQVRLRGSHKAVIQCRLCSC